MKSSVSKGKMLIAGTVKAIRIQSLNNYIYSGSIFTFDTTLMDWYTREFLEQYKIYDSKIKGIYTFPYLVKGERSLCYE